MTGDSKHTYYMLTNLAERMGLFQRGKRFGKEMICTLEQLVGGHGVWMFGLIGKVHGSDNEEVALRERAARMERLMRNLVPPEELFENILKSETKNDMADFYLRVGNQLFFSGPLALKNGIQRFLAGK